MCFDLTEFAGCLGAVAVVAGIAAKTLVAVRESGSRASVPSVARRRRDGSAVRGALAGAGRAVAVSAGEAAEAGEVAGLALSDLASDTDFYWKLLAFFASDTFKVVKDSRGILTTISGRVGGRVGGGRSARLGRGRRGGAGRSGNGRRVGRARRDSGVGSERWLRLASRDMETSGQ